MDTEVEPGSTIEKSRFLNKKDESFGFLCISISQELLFHITDLKTLKEIWDKSESLYGKHDDLRVYQLKNELMSLQPSNFETLNDFFTKFKHTILLLKKWNMEKEDDQLILSILSKLGADYSVFVSTFHAGKLTTPGWNMPTLNAFIESLTCEHDKLVQMGIIWSSCDQALHVLGPKDLNGKGNSRRTQKLNLKLLSLKLKTNSMMNLPVQGRTKEKGTMGKKKSSVLTAGRFFTLNMPA